MSHWLVPHTNFRGSCDTSSDMTMGYRTPLQNRSFVWVDAPAVIGRPSPPTGTGPRPGASSVACTAARASAAAGEMAVWAWSASPACWAVSSRMSASAARATLRASAVERPLKMASE